MGRRRHRMKSKKNRDVIAGQTSEPNTSEQCEQKPDERKTYTDIVKENEKFEKYYKMQEIIPSEEWDSFMAHLKESLPVAFRITGYKGQAKVLLNIITGKYFDDLLKFKNEDKDAPRPFSLPWYPDNLAWQINLSRVVIRTSEELQHLHNFLVSETETGNISRQETVSMIPPLLLNIEPHHKILDMCAAPGSKTSQLIELLHKEENKVPDGLVIANDVDNKRCYMLVHQAKRLNSPCLIVTNHDASNMPNMKLCMDGSLQYLKYDRILCDVPCSGDGTLRKTPDIWQKWNPANANNLHCLQLKIAKRGLELLAAGGRMVYSTCSLNPVEDEAVVSALLQQAGDSAELLDVSTSLRGLKFRQGLFSWKITGRDLELFESYNDVPENYQRQIRSTTFPPSPELAEQLHLERCLRILPHLQDTGGFFVAVIQKNKDKLPWQMNETTNGETRSVQRSPPRKKQRLFGFKEDPFIFFEKDTEDWPPMRDFYGLENFSYTQLLSRCKEGRKRNLYFVSEAVKSIIEENKDNVKIINTGVRTLCRSENKDANICLFRLTQEGIPTILPFMTKRQVSVEQEDMIMILTNEFVDNTKFSENTQSQLLATDSGCIIIIHNGVTKDDNFSIEVCGWKGKHTLRCYVPRPERAHYLRICGFDVTDYEKREKKRFKIKADETAEADHTEPSHMTENIDGKNIPVPDDDGVNNTTAKMDYDKKMDCDKMS